MYFYPIATLTIGGLMSVYVGVVMLVIGVRVASQPPDIITGIIGLGLESGGILMASGALMIVMGGVLRAIVKALRPDP